MASLLFCAGDAGNRFGLLGTHMSGNHRSTFPLRFLPSTCLSPLLLMARTSGGKRWRPRSHHCSVYVDGPSREKTASTELLTLRSVRKSLRSNGKGPPLFQWSLDYLFSFWKAGAARGTRRGRQHFSPAVIVDNRLPLVFASAASSVFLRESKFTRDALSMGR